MPEKLTRRRFVKTAALATAAAPAVRASGQEPPSRRVRLGVIGCGGRAGQLLEVFREFPDIDIPVVCDVIEPRMDRASKILDQGRYPRKPEHVVDYQRILDRNDIDAVVIATTQHWHGLPFLHACQAKKHIFVEKPLSHTVVEGRAMVEAAKKSQVVAMMGTQQRAGAHYRQAVELIHAGRLGKIALVECWNYHNTRNRVGRPADADPPPGYHWDRWLGPAPQVPFNPARLDNSWWFDYGGGMMTNWAVHHIDIILWAMRVAAPTAIACSGGKFVVNDLADTPDTVEASWKFPGFLMQYAYRGFNNFHSVQDRPNHHGICFHGNEATMVLDRSGFEIWNDASPAKPAEKVPQSPYAYLGPGGPTGDQDGPWQRLFVECVRDGKKPPLDLEASHQATVCCHLANIAYLAGRTLRWDGARESIVDDAEASRLLERPRRPGFELPNL
ncbi:MAG: Gfo/Idh/MocA family protein [Pirellulales bacterium]